jgi:hypothetical protein
MDRQVIPVNSQLPTPNCQGVKPAVNSWELEIGSWELTGFYSPAPYHLSTIRKYGSASADKAAAVPNAFVNPCRSIR